MLHSVVGTYIVIVTIVIALKQLRKKNFVISEVTPHTFFALVVLGLVVIVYITGVMGVVAGKCKICRFRWNYHKEIHVRILKFHAILARFNVVFGYLATTTGILVY